MHNYPEGAGYYDFELMYYLQKKLSFWAKLKIYNTFRIIFEFQEYDEENKEYTDEIIKEEYLEIAEPIPASSKFIDLSQIIINFSDDVVDFNQVYTKTKISEIVQNSESYYNEK